jgi:hypothetical protein
MFSLKLAHNYMSPLLVFTTSVKFNAIMPGISITIFTPAPHFLCGAIRSWSFEPSLVLVFFSELTLGDARRQ